ncbi:hypothetical protein BJX65DRAFT_311633 [Aspergillus insuetus]
MPTWKIDEMDCVFYTLKNMIRIYWGAMAALNVLFRRPPDSQESYESAPSEVLYDEDENALSSVVNNGPAFVAGLSKQQDDDDAAEYDFKCPATQYDANSLEEFEEILSVLPKAKQPGPC